jgi:hypothetical protein
VTVDSSLSSTSTNPVQNKVVKAALDAKQNRMTIDSALSATSANPVQNKVVKAALDAKQNRMTIDSALSATSTNPVQNKVVKAALDAKQNRMTIDSVAQLDQHEPRAEQGGQGGPGRKASEAEKGLSVRRHGFSRRPLHRR